MSGAPGLSRRQMAWRAAQDLENGNYVNLGIGLPTAVADFVPQGREIVFHSENGLLGMGPAPAPGKADPDLINAGKMPVTLLKGGSFFVHSDAFVMIRGGHIDVALLGAFEVSAAGDLANWSVDAPGAPPGVGGAMDLAVGARQVRVLMEHNTREGAPRLVSKCRYPLTAAAVVKRIYTNLAVIDVTPSGLQVAEIVAGMDLAALQALTEAPLHAVPGCGLLRAPALAPASP